MLHVVFNFLQRNLNNISNQANLVLHFFSFILVCICICTATTNNIIQNNEDNHEISSSSPLFIVVLSYLASPYFIILYSIPIITSLISWVYFIIQRQRKLSTLYDLDDNPLRCKSESALPPFLPPTSSSKGDKLYDKLSAEVKNKKKISQKDDEAKAKTKLSSSSSSTTTTKTTSGWAMVTGARRGIGRALAVELARYNIPIILVARDEKKLKELSKILNECYGVPTKVIVSDFSNSNAAEELLKKLNNHTKRDSSDKSKDEDGDDIEVEVDILIHNAGISDTNNLTEMNLTKIQDIITVNSITGCKLCQIFGNKMKERKRGRIVIISSITGAVPGVPTASVYAATKAFQKSFCTSIGMELEPFGVGVTCIMPGAVHDTNFSSRSKMDDALIWKFPIGGLTAPIVASSVVRSMISGCPEIVVGWLNVVCVKFLFLLLPERIVTFVTRTFFNPPPWMRSDV
jgi:short-subunit dehydrogenase